MRVKINIGEEVIDLGPYSREIMPRIPIAGEQIRINITDKPYEFDVAGIFWDYVEGSVIIETN